MRVAVLGAGSWVVGQPSATVMAGVDAARAERLQHLFMSDGLRVYTNPDLVGCEIGGAVKNVIAIAAGRRARWGMVGGPGGGFARVPGLDAAYKLLTRVLPLGRGEVSERDGDVYVR